MATVDSLDIKISAEAKKAEASVDSIIGKIGRLAQALDSLDTSAISKQAKRLSDGFSNLNIKGLENITKSAKAAEDSFKKISNAAKKISSIKMTFDASDYQKVIKELSGKFSNAGMGITVEGNLSSLEKQAKKLTSALDKLSEKEEKIMLIGKSAPTGSAFQNLQYDIASTTNRLAEVQKKMESLRRTASDGLDIKIIKTDSAIKSMEYFEDALHRFDKEILESENFLSKGNLLETPIKNLNALLNQLKSTYPQAEDLILSYEEELKRVSALQESALSKSTKFPKAVAQPKQSGFFGGMENTFDGGKEKKSVSIDPSRIRKAMEEMERHSASLKNAGNQSVNFSRMSVPSFNKVTNALKNMGNGMRNAAKKMASMTIPLNNVAKNSNNLAKSLKRLLFGFVSIGGIGSLIKKSIDISSSLTEVQNVVDVAFGKYKKSIEDFSKISIEDFGMSELTAKTIASRFQAMGTAMGFTQGNMADMSIELTKLAADMASFYNVEQEDVAEDLQSIFTGQARPLRTYGLDLTEATLKEWAMKQGMDANIKSMSQAEKTLLRYQYVMANTGAAQGDFARTADTWANQVRVLRQNFEQLASIIGGVFINALKPMVKALNSAMGYVIKFAKTISDALGTIFGWTYEEGGGGITQDWDDAADGAGDLADGMNDVADATGDAEKAQKKFNKQLQDYDELHNLTSGKDSGNNGAGDGNGSGNGAGAGSGAGAYGGKWTQGESILKKFKSEIDSLEKLGKYISESLTKAMESIEWDSIYKKAKNFGKGLADFLNGLFAGEQGKKLFKALGKTIAGTLNTVIYAALSFAKRFKWDEFGSNLAAGVTKFFEDFDWPGFGEAVGTTLKGVLEAAENFFDDTDWSKLGSGLAESLNNAIKTGVIQQYFKTIASAIKAAIETAFSFVTTFDFKDLGKAIGQGINDFMDKMNEVDPKTGLNGWEMLGQTITEGIEGVSDAIITALKTVPWEEVGQAIADFISNIKWKEIIWKLGEVIDSFATALSEALSGAGVPKSLANLIVTAGIDGWIIRKLSKTKLGEAITKKLGDKFSVGLKNVGASVGNWIADKVNKSGLKEKIAEKVGSITTNLRNVVAKVKDWIVDIAKEVLDKLKKLIKERMGTQTVEIDNVNVSTKKLTPTGETPTLSLPGETEVKGKWKFPGLSAALQTAIAGVGSLGLTLVVSEFIMDRNPAKTISKITGGHSNGTNIMTEEKKKKHQERMKDVDKSTKSLGEFLLDGLGGEGFSITKKGLETTLNIKTNMVADSAKKIINNLTSDKDKTITAKAKTSEANRKFKDLTKDTTKTITAKFKMSDEAKKLLKNLDKMATSTQLYLTSSRREKGGIFENGKWRDIPQYAAGGFPSHGTLFAAGEAGAEVVGHIGGRTEVLNQSQLASVMEASIANANAEGNALLRQEINVLARQNELLMQILQKETGITSGEIARAVQREDSIHWKRTGMGLLAH